MNLPLKILDIKLVPTGPYIPLLKPIPLHDPMNVSYQHVVPDIKFSLFKQQWTIHVELDDECHLRAIVVLSL